MHGIDLPPPHPLIALSPNQKRCPVIPRDDSLAQAPVLSFLETPKLIITNMIIVMSVTRWAIRNVLVPSP